MQFYQFNNRQECHDFFVKNHNMTEGFWIKFDKQNTAVKLTADDALYEALCFGWIDGIIKRLDDQYYCKYFSPRRPDSRWSERNKQLAESLMKAGLMEESGKQEIEKAKREGRWAAQNDTPEDFSLEAFDTLLTAYPSAYDHYQAMSPSVKKTYAMSYFALKKSESREKRLLVIVQRLKQGLKPM